MKLCMTKPEVFHCIYHDGDASEVYEFIKEHMKYYQSVQIPMGRDPFPVVELCYSAAVPRHVLKHQWAIYEADRSSIDWSRPMVHPPQSHQYQDVCIEPGQWLLVRDGEPFIVSAAEFKTKYCECLVQ